MTSILTVSLLIVIVGSQECSHKFSPSFCSSFKTHHIRCTPSDDSLEAVTVIFRHGERTKYYDIPQLQNVKIPADAKLTKKGKEGSRQLGAFLQCRYGSYLSTSPTPKVTVASSNISRTVESAAAVLEGLNMNVSIHVIPRHGDNRIYRVDSRCPSYERSMNSHISLVMVPPPKLVEHLYNVTGDVKTYVDAFRIYDTVLVEHCQLDVQLPSWFCAPDLHPFYTHFFVGYVHDSRSARLFNGPLLHDILASLMNGDRSMNLYSGHDTTISSMMEVMNVYELKSPPPYNAVLIFERHKLGCKQEVRVFYGGDERETLKQLSLPWCPTPCTLSSFTNKMTPFSMDDELWTQECESSIQ